MDKSDKKSKRNGDEEETKLDYAFTIVPETISLPPKSGIVF